MTCLSSTERAAIEAKIVIIVAQISAANTALTAALGNSEIEEYSFGSGSGEGLQRAIRRDPNQIEKLIDRLESRLNRLTRKLNGTLNVTMTFRRRPC